MNSLARFAVLIAAFALCLAAAYAKRSAPEPVEPVVYQGVKYIALNQDKDDGRYIAALDEKTSETLWELKIYQEKFDENLERDVQEVFIVSLEIAGEKLLITNEKGETFRVDLEQRRVVDKRIYVPEAYQCASSDDCINTCAHGAINRVWYEANREELGECKDGCSSKGFDPPQCTDGICVASFRGEKRDSCTQSKIWYYDPS